MNTRLISQIVLLVGIISSCNSYQYSVHYIHADYLEKTFGAFNGDFLGFRFFLDTITISNPCMAIYKDDIYIMCHNYLPEFANHPYCAEGLKVFRVLPHNIRQDIMDVNDPSNECDFSDRALSQLRMATDGHGLYHPNTYLNGQLEYEGTMDNIEIYRFKKLPERFLLEMVWYDPKRYEDNPYGPNYHVDYASSYGRKVFENKLDSLESVPFTPSETDKPHYVLTVEPLYSRETINEYILENEEVEKLGPFTIWKPKLFSKRYVKKHCFTDL